ncbi:MAG: glucose-6-phosphate dehydrogenase assembly protein OpcA [Frankiaceae bacterium]|nr:glucose-6-phosphate dehydrogenase assembly protein OpcA [Frankiaceae bacterium]MBV9869485.1 glucose-6-phosphate dehydrogenase assembly protein OpcA [Frankiaceae bacterium]
MTALWDTNGGEIIKALVAERRTAGALASGLALTLVIVVDEKRVREAEDAATVAAAAHPCRVLIVVRHSIEGEVRLDAEVLVGGRLGPTEAVIMRMYGRLALHAESVVLPLLAPDAPVVTWWHGVPPEEIATDALGVLASRRVTDCSLAPEPLVALGQRAADFVAGDTDLTWTRATLWRSLLASAMDGLDRTAQSATVTAETGNPTAAMLCGWLTNRLQIQASLVESSGPGITEVVINTTSEDGDEYVVKVERTGGGDATLTRGDAIPRILPLPRESLGDLLAEELRRMDTDPVYAEALSTITGVAIDEQARDSRVLVWRDPALASK